MRLYRSDLRAGRARGRLRHLLRHLRRDRRPEAVEPGQAGKLRVRHRADAQPPGGGRFPVKYYLTAMLFIVFDIEIIFLYPWAVTFNKLGAFGLVEMVTFVITVLVAYAYVWRRGGLEWD